MEDDYLQENVGYAFLTTQEAISIFADVDYALKSGKHILDFSRFDLTD